MKIFSSCFVILMVMFGSWINDATAQQKPAVTPVSDRTPQVRDAIVAAAGVPADEVTEAHLAAITLLDLGQKNITALKGGDFDGLNNLTGLYLPYNQLSTLPSGIFDNLTQLTGLELHGNQLSTLPSDIFDNLTQLTTLRLWGNQLSTLPSDIFDNLTQLSSLYLDSNQLSTVPSDIFDNLTQLTQLWLGNNQLSTVPSGIFDNLTQLSLLSLGGNQLSTVPSDIFDNLTQLTQLHLGNNQLSTVPSGIFDNLTQLTELQLWDNQLSTLSSGIFDNLTQLTTLSLAGNQLSTVPAGIFAGLTELTTLWLHGNAVDPLPLPVSLEPVGNGTFKAVASTGAPFDIVLPFVVSNGSLTTGATAVTIHKGGVESEVLTVNRTPGSAGAVTVNIGVLPGIPTDVNRYNQPNHQGYALVKSGTLPLVVISGIVDPPPPIDDPPPLDDPPPPTNNPPVFTEGASTTRTVAENTVAGIDIGSAVSATDADGDTLTYALSGTDAAAFRIVNTTGQLRTQAALDYETKSVYTVAITVSDGSLTDTITVTITVTDVDEGPANRAPVFTEGASTTRTIAENTVAGIDIGSAVSATDADGDTLTYTLSGTDAAAFRIVNTTGQLRTQAALDYETKSVYTVAITVSDGSLTDTISVTITVTDIDEGPANTVTPVSDRTPQVRDAIVAAAGVAADEVTEAHLAAITELHLNQTNITRLKGGDFDGLNNLTVLTLYNNQLSILPSGIFDNLTQLTVLYLHNNQLSTLPSGIFDNLTQLTVLYLHNNQLSILPSGIFNNLTQLSWLYLNGNRFSTLPSGIFNNLTQLSVLSLERNQLSTLPSGIFDNLKQLSSLYLDGNQLSTLPSDIFDNLTQLTELWLWRNQLSTLPSGIFDNLTQLASLLLNGNQLSTLPSGIFDNLTQLASLLLDGNQLSTLPSGIFDNLTQLIHLRLWGNQLSTLPSGIFDNLTQLEWLLLNGNQLSTLPDGVFSGLTELTYLWLHGNAVDPLLLPVSLAAVGNGTFKAVAPTGAPFDIVLPLVVSNGSLTTGATTVTIHKGQVESEVLTVNRTPGTSGAVTVNIGVLPGIPTDTDVESEVLTVNRTPDTSGAVTANIGVLPEILTDTEAVYNFRHHQGYALVKSGTLPLVVISGIVDPPPPIDDLPPPTNNPPVFTEGASTTRTVAENTAAGVDIGSAVSATDADDDPLTYTLSGTDAAAFRIVNTTGQLRTWAALDYETKSVYTVAITVSDGSLTDTISVTITVTDIDEGPANTVTPVSDRTPQVRDAIVAAAGVPADEVTEAHLAAITELHLNQTNITRLKGGDFDGLNNLTVLTLYNNQLSILPSGIFDNLTQLTVLYLHNNQLSTLPSGIFDNLIQLTVLYLHNNQLSILPSGIFDNLTQLSWLYLNGNRFSTLPSGIFDNLTQLSVLSLERNQLSTLPSDIFDNLKQLSSVYLDSNQLSILPSDIFDNLTQLTELWLGNNQLSILPSDIFDNLTQLSSLILGNNQLSTLPSGIFDNLTQLASLLLNGNQLSILPSDIFDNLTQLSLLYLDGNQLSTLPSGIFDNLTQLAWLLLNGNQLSTLPSGIFAGLTELTYLWLHGNAVDPLLLPVSLEAVGNGTFKAVAPTGAPFDIVLPLVVSNGSLTTGATPVTNSKGQFVVSNESLTTGATTVTIHRGGVESEVLTVNRTPGTSGAVTVNIGVLPGIPTDADAVYNFRHHQGYALVKSGTLPLVVISGIVDPPLPIDDPPSPTNNPPVFTEGANTTRTVAENTAAGVDIGSAVSATDADDDPLTYTLSGTDAAAFRIDNTTGQLKTSAALDAAIKSVYSVTVAVSDGRIAAVSDSVYTVTITVTINVTDVEMPPVLDVNSDGVVDIDDLVLVAASFGATVDSTTPNPADVNDDGVVDLTDLLLVIGGMESTADVAAAPGLSEANLRHWIVEAKRESLGNVTFEKGIAVLEQLLDAVRPTPKETLLLSNYPNPFNPETWIPYHLANRSNVSIIIYNMRGNVIRRLELGHQQAGYYTSRSRAAHWDGKNTVGEPVASGIYFYTLTAGNFSATRKMLIRK